MSMTAKLAETEITPGRAAAYPPYPASEVDRFLAWVDRLHLPSSLFYLLFLAALIILFNGLAWIDGSRPFPAFDLYRSSVAVYPVASLALIQYLNRVANRALAAFRPALGVEDPEYRRLAYMLVTLPQRGTRITLALSLIFTASYITFTPYLATLFGQSPWIAAVESVVYVFCFGMIAVFIYHTIRQLRMVSLIHASATNVNLFRRTPLYAFSNLTAQTGISLLLMNYFGILTDPATFENVALIALTIGASFVAILCFVLPLRGMHDRIAAEKNRLHAECSTRLERAIGDLYARADSEDLAEVEGLNQLMGSLVKTCEIIDKIPAWPWERETVVTFVSVFLLPFIVRLIAEIVDQLGLLNQLLPI
jgi:hypothetical protein